MATLVEVTNTVAAPAISQDVSHLAAQHVELQCGGSECVVPSPAPSPYVVPVGQNFVVTSVDIRGNGAGGNIGLDFIDTACCVRTWIVPNDGFTHSFQSPSGYVFPAGYTFNSANVTVDGGIFAIFMEGFLTAN